MNAAGPLQAPVSHGLHPCVLPSVSSSAGLKDSAIHPLPSQDGHHTDRPYKSVKAKKSETFAIAGRYGGHPGKVADEWLSLSDRQTKKLTAVRKDAIHVKPVLAKALRRSFRTAIKAIDGYASHAKPLYSDRVKLTDGEKNMLAIVRKEMMHITEIYWDNVLFLIHITENIRTTDALQKAMSVQMRDSFRFLDWLSKCPGLNKRDSVDIAEGERQKIEHVLYDSLNLLDGLRRDIRHIVSEKLKKHGCAVPVSDAAHAGRTGRF